MFLSAKPLIIIISMYCMSIILLGGQWAIADVFGITLTDFYGHPLAITVNTLINTQNANVIQQNATSTNPVTWVVNTVTTSGDQLTELIKLATGTTIFNVLFYLGVPAIIVSGMTLVYVMFLLILIASALYRVMI